MKIIDRYVSEIGRKLPLVKGRKDIENELRSTLEDMLEDRAQNSGRPADEAMELELLKEYGSPQDVAETYNPNPYLIGPRMYPFFIFVLKIVLAAVALGLGIATGIQVISQSPMSTMELLSTIGGGLLNILSAWIAAFGNIVLIFTLIERFAPAAEFNVNEDEEWDPDVLLKEPETNDVKIWEPILAIVLIFIAISIFNFNRHLIGLYHFDGKEWQVIPLLTEAFFRWLPLMNIGWVAEIVLNGVLLRNGKWTTSTRLASIGTKALQIVILGLLISGPNILALTPENLKAIGVMDQEAISMLQALSDKGMDIILGLGIFGNVVEILKSILKLTRQNNA